MSQAEALPQQRVWDQELWVGLFVILGLVATLGLLFALTTPATFRGRYHVEARVPDAGGVRKGDPVQMRGVTIGSVRRFDIVPGGVAMRLELDRSYQIPVDSRVELQASGLLGATSVNVVPGSSPQMLKSGQSLSGTVVPQLSGKVEDFTTEATKALGRVQELLSPQMVDNVQASSSEMHEALGQLNTLISEQRDQLAALSESLRSSAQGIQNATAGPAPKEVVQNLDAITRRLNQTTETLDRSARSAEAILGRLEHGQGSLGKLTQDDTLYRNANQAVVNLGKTADALTKLSEDIRKDPKKYFSVKVF